jgi:TetR/AcrR family transcriptional regulator
MNAPRFLADKLCAARGKRERRKEARPGELLEAALDLFVEKGFAATRSEEVAARAGVSKGTLFLYFQSKEELFKAVVRENLTGEFTEWNRELDEYEGSTADMLRDCMRVWWQKVGSTKASGLAKLMLSEGRNFPELAEFYYREAVQPRHELLRRIIRRGIERGEFAPMDVEFATQSVIAPMLLMMLKQTDGACATEGRGAFDPEAFLAFHAETLLHGLCRPAPSPAATAAIGSQPLPRIESQS